LKFVVVKNILHGKLGRVEFGEINTGQRELENIKSPIFF